MKSGNLKKLEKYKKLNTIQVECERERNVIEMSPTPGDRFTS